MKLKTDETYYKHKLKSHISNLSQQRSQFATVFEQFGLEKKNTENFATVTSDHSCCATFFTELGESEIGPC